MGFTRRGVRAVARALVVAGLAAGSITASGGAASAANQLPPVVTLTSSHVVAGSGQTVQLYAQASYAEYNMYLEIQDAVYGYTVASCWNTTYCYSWHAEEGGSRTFIAVARTTSSLAPTRSASAPVTVYWADETAVVLTAAPSTTLTGTTSRLTAVADDWAGPAYIQIWDVTAGASAAVRIANCASGTSCTATVSSPVAGTRSYHALLLDYSRSTYAPWYAERQSGIVPVTWVDPPPTPRGSTASLACDQGQQVIESTTEGVRVKMYVSQPSANETHVCVRAENALDGVGVGGQFVITPTVPGATLNNVQTPSSDGSSTACTTTPGNAIAGPHPLATGGVAGTPYLLDAYATGGGAWICVQAGASTKVRVLVPVAVPQPSVTPGTQVQFNPDPGTPDLV